MENINLLKTEKQGELSDIQNLKGLPYFIIIQKSENKKIKIPCANENIAKRLLASYANGNCNSK